MQHPTDPQDLNRYAYARNNPIMFNDPTGLGFWSKLFGFIGAVLGVVFTAGAAAPVIFAAALIGGIIGGAIGGLTDAALSGNSLLRGALFGAAEGAVTGAAVGIGAAVGGAVGGGGSNALSPNARIVMPQYYLDKMGAGVGEVIKSSGVSKITKTIIGNAIGATVGAGIAYATQIGGSQSSPAIESQTMTVQVFSRPALWNSARHMFFVDDNMQTGELLKQGRMSHVSRSINNTDNEFSDYIHQMRGALNKVVDKQKFEAAFEAVKNRYDGTKYIAADSNNFMIELFKEAGSPLTNEELGSLGIECKPGFNNLCF